MTASAVDQRFACEDCGSTNLSVSELVRRLREEVRLRDSEIGRARAQVAKLRGDQVKSLTADPQYREAVAVLTLWQELIMPSAHEITGAARMKPTLARLRHFSLEEMCECVRGYAAFPFVVSGERVATGTKKQWYADIDTIFANPKRVEKGIELAQRVEGIRVAIAKAETWFDVLKRQHGQIVSALSAECELSPSGGYDCPSCGWEGTVRVASNLDGLYDGRLAFCVACDIDERDLLAMIADPCEMFGVRT
jgi:hypothetical protein